jgi:putative aldouronate transport system substrate-binding protein
MKHFTKVIFMITLLVFFSAFSVFAAGEKEQASEMGKIEIPYKGDPVEITVYMPGGGTPEEAMQRLVWSEFVSRLGNITIKYIEPTIEEFDEQRQLLLASGDLHDIMGVRHSKRTSDQYGGTGVLLDFNKYTEYMPNFTAMTKAIPSLNHLVTGNGNRFVMPGLNWDKDYLGEAWMVNKTLLDQLGISIPKTSDELMGAMKKIKSEVDGSSPFIYGWKGYSDMLMYSGLVGMFCNYRNMTIGFDQESKKFVFGPTDPSGNFKETLMFMNEMYENGLFDANQEVHTLDQYKATMQNAKWGFAFWYVNGAATPSANGLIKPGEEYEIVGMATPVGPKGDASVCGVQTLDGIPYWGVVSNAETDYPELVAKLMDYNWSEESTTLFNWGIEGDTFKVNSDGSKEYLPSVQSAKYPNGDRSPVDLGLGDGGPIKFAMLKLVDAAYARSYSSAEMKIITPVVDGFVSGQQDYINFYDPVTPPVSEAEADRISQIMNPVRTFIEESVYEFVKGDRSFDEWDSFVEEVNSYGDIDWILELYNSKLNLRPKRVKRDWNNYF